MSANKGKMADHEAPERQHEPEAVISPLEEKVESWRQRISLAAGPNVKMIRAGFLFDLGGGLLLWAGLRLLLPLAGLA